MPIYSKKSGNEASKKPAAVSKIHSHHFATKDRNFFFCNENEKLDCFVIGIGCICVHSLRCTQSSEFFFLPIGCDLEWCETFFLLLFSFVFEKGKKDHSHKNESQKKKKVDNGTALSDETQAQNWYSGYNGAFTNCVNCTESKNHHIDTTLYG